MHHDASPTALDGAAAPDVRVRFVGYGEGDGDLEGRAALREQVRLDPAFGGVQRRATMIPSFPMMTAVLTLDVNGRPEARTVSAAIRDDVAVRVVVCRP